MRSVKIYFVMIFLLLLLAGVLVFISIDAGTLVFIGAEILIAALCIVTIICYLKIIHPYKRLKDAVNIIREQDFSTTLRPTGLRETDLLIDVFNEMIAALKNERLTVRERTHITDLLIEATPLAIISTDPSGFIETVNPAAERLFSLSKNAIVGKPVNGIVHPLIESITATDHGPKDLVRLADASSYMVLRSSFYDKGFRHPFIVIEDLTEPIQSAEREANEKIVRLLAHEVNNTLAAVNTTLEALASTIEIRDIEGASELISATGDSCRSLGRFVSDISSVMAIPEPHRDRADIFALVKSVKEISEAECLKRDVVIKYILEGENFQASVDTAQMEQVLLNLVRNSLEASVAGTTIVLTADGNVKSVRVSDDGPGFFPGSESKVFTPFFSTKSENRGLGLMLVREVLSRHGFQFGFLPSDKGTCFEIRMD